MLGRSRAWGWPGLRAPGPCKRAWYKDAGARECLRGPRPPTLPTPRSGEQEVLALAAESPSFDSESAMVRAFTPWEAAVATNQGLPWLPHTVSCRAVYRAGHRGPKMRLVQYRAAVFFLSFIRLITHQEKVMECPRAGLERHVPRPGASRPGSLQSACTGFDSTGGACLHGVSTGRHSGLGAPKAAGTVRTASRAVTPKPSSEG